MDTAAIFTGMYATLTEARCQLRVGGKAILARCLSSTSGADRQSTEWGQTQAASIEVRLLAADEAVEGKRLPNGSAVELMPFGFSEWLPHRVVGRHVTGAVLRLTLEATYA